MDTEFDSTEELHIGLLAIIIYGIRSHIKSHRKPSLKHELRAADTRQAEAEIAGWEATAEYRGLQDEREVA